MKEGASRKYLAKVGDYERQEREGAISLKFEKFLEPMALSEHSPDISNLRLKKHDASGVFLGCSPDGNSEFFIGMPEGSDGNLVAIGGNGSGKSQGVAIPTLQTWRSAICATDIKGELSEQYGKMFHKGSVIRPYITFDPTRADGPSYDPFWWLLTDDATNLVSNVWEIVRAVIPLTPDDRQPFWVETEQGVFAAALLYYFMHGLSFSQSVCLIVSQPTSSLTKTLMQSPDVRIRMLMGEAANMKDETLACIDRGLRNKLMLLAADPQISHALRGQREGANCFTWDDLKHYQIFLRIPAHKIEQWSGVVNLMYAQLFRYLERRPEQYTPEADEHPQLLLLMDEFARFGKLDSITSALSTLRSKKVNICLFVQSVAQIDRFYGSEERRIIFDNCQYQAILRANDPETQRFICQGIGMSIQRRHGIGKQFDRDMKKTGFSVQISESQDWVIAPHELSTLHDVLLLTPDGFFRIKKSLFFDETSPEGQDNESNDQHIAYNICPTEIGNGGAIMQTIEQRTQTAKQRIENSKRQERRDARQAQAEQRKNDNRRKYFIGALVLKYFPALREIELRNNPQGDREQFQDLEAILATLAGSPDLMKELRDRANQRAGISVYDLNV